MSSEPGTSAAPRAADGCAVEEEATDRLPVAETTVRRLQELVLSGRIKPGQKLPSQRDLALEFDISRTSLREALRVLETLGLVRVEHGRGAIVCDPSMAAAPPHWRFGDRFPETDVFQLRMLMETYTARLAAPRISDAQLRALHANLDAMRAAMRDQDLEASARIDLAFHRLLVGYAGNKMFAGIYDMITGVMLELHRLPLLARDRLWEPVTEHEHILSALERHDPDGAAYYMRLHLIRTAGRSGIDEARCLSW